MCAAFVKLLAYFFFLNVYLYIYIYVYNILLYLLCVDVIVAVVVLIIRIILVDVRGLDRACPDMSGHAAARHKCALNMLQLVETTRANRLAPTS